jgi:hypothetical protein
MFTSSLINCLKRLIVICTVQSCHLTRVISIESKLPCMPSYIKRSIFVTWGLPSFGVVDDFISCRDGTIANARSYVVVPDAL